VQRQDVGGGARGRLSLELWGTLAPPSEQHPGRSRRAQPSGVAWEKRGLGARAAQHCAALRCTPRSGGRPPAPYSVPGAAVQVRARGEGRCPAVLPSACPPAQPIAGVAQVVPASGVVWRHRQHRPVVRYRLLKPGRGGRRGGTAQEETAVVKLEAAGQRVAAAAALGNGSGGRPVQPVGHRLRAPAL
jgi:hypothetical protein